MDRVFHHQFTLVAKCAIVLFTLFSLWCFWHMMPFAGFITAIFVVLIIERVLHTTYTFMHDDQGNNILRVDRGRLSHHKDIRVADIVKVIPMQTAFGASRYLLVKYGPNRLISLQPDDQTAFMSELKKRQ